jgi:hypothetical protein
MADTTLTVTHHFSERMLRTLYRATAPPVPQPILLQCVEDLTGIEPAPSNDNVLQVLAALERHWRDFYADAMLNEYKEEADG